MKKELAVWVVILTVIFGLFTSACAMGPIYTGPKTAVWDPVSGATGYYLYWRAPGGTWDNAKRLQTNAATVDLSLIPAGNWELCATAFNSDSESGPSNIVTWAYSIIGAPGNLKRQ